MNNFVNRLEFILQHYELNASAFADKIGVQRSSLSHILSGRNKASLDVILKINEAFSDIRIEWLIQGIEPVFSSSFNNENTIIATENFSLKENPSVVNSSEDFKKNTSKKTTNTSPISSLSNHFFTSTDVEQIVVFYKDGTFTTYKPRQ